MKTAYAENEDCFLKEHGNAAIRGAIRPLSRRRMLAASAGLALAGCGARASTGSGGEDVLRAALEPHVASGFIPGFTAAVRCKGETFLAAAGTQGYGGAPMQAASIFRIASITKPVTAVAALMLVEEGRLSLDEPVDDLLPELADRRVLRSIDAELDDTIPARRPISLRDLLTMRFGLGAIMTWPPADYPIQKAMIEKGVSPDYGLPAVSPDDYMARLGALPLAAQPGEAFFYDTGMHVAGVLIARAAGVSLGAFLRERIFYPLGMRDTGFWTPEGKQDRLTALYRVDPETGERTDLGQAELPFTSPPVFESGSSGLVSTAPDYLAFQRALLDRGEVGGERLISEESFDLMVTDQLTPEQRRSPHVSAILGVHSGWGLGIAVDRGGGALGFSEGSFGWHGGYGSTAYADPSRDLIGVLLTPRVMDSPEPSKTYADFWRAAYALAE